MDDVFAGSEHHAEYGQLGQGHAEGLDLVAEFAAVERARHHRTTTLGAAGRLGVVVREYQRHVETERSLTGEKIDRLGPGAQERIDACGVKVVAGFVPQVSPRLLGRLR